MEMLHQYLVHGIMFADIETAFARKEEILGKCPVKWRLTFGGKVLAVAVPGAGASLYLGEPIVVIDPNQVWQWPVVPMTRTLYSPDLPDVIDCWATGTASRVALRENTRRIEAEVNPKKHKLSHRVVWADRKRGKFVTDPLLRQEFATLEAVRCRWAGIVQMYRDKQEWKEEYG